MVSHLFALRVGPTRSFRILDREEKSENCLHLPLQSDMLYFLLISPNNTAPIRTLQG